MANAGGKPTREQADVLIAQSRLFRSCVADVSPSATVTALSGSATRVGDATDRGQVKMAGALTLSPASGKLDLGKGTLRIERLLAETRGTGELVDRVAAGPVELIARPGGKPTSATYESSPAAGRPSFRMNLKQRSGGVVEFTLKVDRAVLSHDPSRCSAVQPSTTNLLTSFAIDDGLHGTLTVAATRRWECVGREPQSPSELKLR